MNTEEYNTCVSKIGPNLLRFVTSNVRDLDASKDIVQDAFVVLWKKKEDVEVAKAKSFLFTTANFKLIDFIRKNKKLSSIDGVERAEEKSFAHPMEDKEIINRSLATLQENSRRLITLRDLEGYSYEEIGKITGYSPSKVKVTLFRARKQLKLAIIKLDATYGN